MVASEEQSKAIGGVLQALVTNIANMTPEAIVQLTQQILSVTPPCSSVPVMTNAQLDLDDGNPGGTDHTQSGAIMAQKKGEKVKKDRVNLRPLNAFICFRSYYSHIFAGLTQRLKSGFIRQLWENDHWKHFWAIEAKAYSNIRDAHPSKVSLDAFLDETVGLLGIIPADEYLPTMGWKLDIDCHPSQYRLVKMGPAKGMLNAPLSTNISVAEIVSHCYEVGLVERPVQPRTNAAAAGVAMAFAAHPSHLKIPIVAQESQATGTFTDKHGFFAGMHGQTEADKQAAGGEQTMKENAEEEAGSIQGSGSFGENLSIETATADLQRALERYPDQYPYAHHFHPAVDTPILAFDPNVVQDRFDPFNLNDYVNFDNNNN